MYCEYKGKIFRFFFTEFATKVSISWIHNNSDYSIFYPKSINTVGWVMPENYPMSHNRVYTGKIDHP